MSQFTGYLLGKVQLDGAVRSEVLASLVETLIQKFNTPSSTDQVISKKKVPDLLGNLGNQGKFSDKNKYLVECSERGLKLTSPGFKSKDEGFESDCESLRSIRITNGLLESTELDLTELFDQLEITKDDDHIIKGGDGVIVRAKLLDNSSISSSSGLHVTSSDDSHSSSSGNGSDSDEFSGGSGGGGVSPQSDRSPSWEVIPTLASFQSYSIEDIVFCHCDSLHSSTLVWMVRHLAKMVALVTYFRTKSEAQELFNTYRELRLKLKPNKNKISSPVKTTSINNNYNQNNSNSSSTTTSPAVSFISCSTLEPPSPKESEGSFFSLPTYPLYPPPEGFTAEPTVEQSSNPQTDFDSTTKFFGDKKCFSSNGSVKSESFGAFSLSKKTGRSAFNFTPFHFTSNFDEIRDDQENVSAIDLDDDDDDDDEDQDDENNSDGESVDERTGESKYPPKPPQRKYFTSKSKPIVNSKYSSNNKVSKKSSKPILLVPLKTENMSSSKSNYPKESYLYQVMGRTSSSTFAPYQRTLNFMPGSSGSSGSGLYNNGSDQMKWGIGNGRQLLVPFSSWLELSDISHAGSQHKTSPNNGTTSTSGANNGKLSLSSARIVKGRLVPRSSAGNQKVSALSLLSPNSKGTSKILLRDSSGNTNGVWATLSQRFKRNIRENLMVKINGMWPQDGRKGRKPNKKVTFNAWATVQMV